MSIKAVLFDLDGTLLPMDQEYFTKAYLHALAKSLAPHGYEPQELIGTVWAGTKAMLVNDGSRSNSEAFWRVMEKKFGKRVYDDFKYFDEFYAKEFPLLKHTCGYDENAAKTIALCKSRGFKVVLASNPVFPLTAYFSRLAWAGIDPNEFCYHTTYDNARYCKPHTGYYADIAKEIGVLPEECAMIGNDVSDDMPARDIGMKVFLITNCLINIKNKDISCYEHGGFPELNAFIERL